MELKKTNIIVRNVNDFNNYVDYVSELEQQCKKQKEVIDKIKKTTNDYKEYCENNAGFTEYTDIEIDAIKPVITNLENILKEGKND